MNCLNCKKALQEADAYCSACGQAASTGRLQTGHVMHHFYHAFTHTDKGFFYLIRELLFRPGIIAREYNEGRRKTYFSPFTFVIIVVALSTLLVTTFDIMLLNNARRNPVDVFINKHFNIVVFFSIPLIAYFTSLLFKNRRINFAESIVLASYTSGERSIFFMFIVVPLLLLFTGYYQFIIYTYLAAYTAYYAWACCQYFSSFSPGTFMKGVLAFILAQVIVTLLITLAHIIYYYGYYS